MQTRTTLSLILGAALALSAAGSAHAGWDGFIKSGISQFGEPVRLEMVNDGGGYKLHGQIYKLPIEYRVEVSGNMRKLTRIDAAVRHILKGQGKTFGIRRDLDGKEAAWGKVTMGLDRAHLAPMEKLGKDACKDHAGAGVKEIATTIPVQMTVHFTDRDREIDRVFTKDGSVPARIMCHPQQPKRDAVALKLTDLKVYTVPAKPACGKPVRLVAEFWTNKPGKVDFQLARGDGEMQKASVQTQSVGGKYVKRWGKEYKFDKSESRKYMILVTGHPASSNWVPIEVACGANRDVARPGGVKG